MTYPERTGPKSTRRWVLLADRTADRVIKVGGVLVIAAVLGMMVFFFYEVLPLFRGGEIVSHASYTLDEKGAPVLSVSMDDYHTVAASVEADGSIRTWHVKTGKPVSAPGFDFGGKRVSAFGRAIDGSHMAFGFPDGTVRLGRVLFRSEVLAKESLPAGLKSLDDKDGTDGNAIYSPIPGNQVRKMSVSVESGEEIVISETGSPIVALGYQFSDFGEKPRSTLATVDGQGAVSLSVAESKLNLFTRKVTTSVEKTALPSLPQDARPAYALVNDVADAVYLAEKTSRVFRYTIKDAAGPQLAETLQLLPNGVELTVLDFLLGDRSMVAGGSDGSVGVYFPLPRDKTQSIDGITLVRAREFTPQMGAIESFSCSQRDKTFATADSKGNICIRHATAQATQLRMRSSSQGPVQQLALAPRLDGVFSLDRGRADYWAIFMPHPESSWHTLFGKVWYEGYPEPTYTWQSTGGTDSFEPKLSLVPLIFGTLKATFYSLLFAIPIALLAAIYTSEFLHPRISGKVKPVMEIMASLPSVVLGFVAALVLAPVVENWITGVIIAFAVIPAFLVGAAYAWQLLPPPLALRLEGVPKFAAMFMVVGGGLYAAYAWGPGAEKLFFGGDFKIWVSGREGSATPLLFLLVLPVMALAVSSVASRLFGLQFTRYLRTLNPPCSALVDMARWVAVVAVVAVTTYFFAAILEWVGLDPRAGLVGTYVQRNTLVVGFAMGFAVIPLIYTLAEDALNAVPEHLRSASLGCGATPWQTAIWIILPTAVSGVFSAVMIGMGRAVGETMIVVMSAGNTPVLDLNIFNGLRALSANIAVELPEAPKDGTLYRVLFFTGLVLFSMTFVINTVAEMVRLRFRKRAMQL